MTVVARTPRHQGTVVAVEFAAPRMRRISLDVPTLTGPPYPAQDVELFLPGVDGRPVKRRYTIRDFAPGRFAVEAVLHADGRHSDGPGAVWAASTQPGDAITLAGPRGSLRIAPAEHHLLVGDESALPAIIELARQVSSFCAVVEVADPSDAYGLDARWVPRGTSAPGHPDRLAGALAALQSRPGTHAYLLGETRAMIALRPHADRLADAVSVKGYWNRGRS